MRQGKSNKEIQRQIDIALARYSDQTDAMLVRELLERIDEQQGASPFAWAGLFLLEAIIADPEGTNVRDALLRSLVSDDLQRDGVSDARAAFNVLNAHGLH